MSFFEQERVFNTTTKQQAVPDYGWNKQQKRFFNHPNNLLKTLLAAEYMLDKEEVISVDKKYNQ